MSNNSIVVNLRRYIAERQFLPYNMAQQQRIGITGGIGSGKSTVCRVLETMGFPVYYSDDEAKRIMQEDTELIAAIKAEFGEASYTGRDSNRAYIARIIFQQPEKKDSLNALVHPRVRADFAAWSKRQKSDLVFQESALLFETNGYKLLDKTVLVTAPEAVRIQRVSDRDQLSPEAIAARIRNQMPDVEKIPLADFVIENDGIQLVIPQVLELVKVLEEN